MRPTLGYVAGGIDTPPMLMCGICASTGRIFKGLYQPKADFCQLFQYAGNWLRYFGSGLNKGTFNKQKENLNWKPKLSLNYNLMIALRMA